MRLRSTTASLSLVFLLAACGGDGTDATPGADTAAEDTVPADPDVAPDVIGGDDVPAPLDLPVPLDVPAGDDTGTRPDVPLPEDVPPIEDLPASEDLPPPADVPLVDDVPLVEDVPAAADVPLAPDVTWEHDPSKVTLHGACPAAIRHGGFKVEMNEEVGYTAIDGVVKNGVAPGLVPDEALREGDCVLLRRRRLVCDPPCEPNTTCDVGATCVPTPLGQDAGQVTFRGLAVPVTLSPIQPGNTYFYTRLPHPGFEPGTVIQLTSTNGYAGALELYGVGVTSVVPTETTWTITEGVPMDVHWDASPEGARSRIFAELNIDQHGATPLTMVCDLPDTGEASIPASVTDGLIAAGVTGFPTGRLTRRTVDSATEDERCVDFVVSSVRPIAIEVTGHIPCTRDEDCPPPGSCDLLIQQCE